MADEKEQAEAREEERADAQDGTPDSVAETIGILEAGRALERKMLEEAPPSFTFACGLTVHIRRVNRVFAYKVRNAARDKLVEKEGGKIPVPTFTVELAGGETESHEFTEESVKLEPYCNDADIQDAWREYSAQQFRLEYEEVSATIRAYILRGVVESDPPESWLEEQRYFGLALADNPLDLKWDWLNDISTGWNELLSLARDIQTLPDGTELAAQAAAESF